MVAPTPAVPASAARPRRMALPRLGAARWALSLLAALVAVAALATAAGFVAQIPRSGLLVTGSGRVLMVTPGSAAAAAGLRVGDTVTAVDAVPVSGFNLWSAQQRAIGEPLWLTEGPRGRYLLFALQPGPPSALEVAAGMAVLVTTLLLWLSALIAGWPRRRDRAARCYAVAALCLALALCALVARDGGALWAWLALTPAALAGPAALLLAHLALAGSVPRRAIAGITAVAAVPALLAALGVLAPLPEATVVVVAVGFVVLAVAALLLPLVAHSYTPAEPSRRALRVALLASIAGLLPIGAWPGVVTALALAGRDDALAQGTQLLPLWCALALAPMALLYTLLFLQSDTRRLDERARAGASYVAAAAPLAVVVALAPTLPRPGQIAAVVAAAILFPFLQRGIERLLAYAVRQPRADYAAALRLVENAAAEAAAPVGLATAVAGGLAPLLATRSATLLLRGLECPADAYRLVDATGCAATIVQPEPALVATAPGAARPVATSAQTPSLERLGIALWAPLWWDNAQRGALALGPRIDGDPYQDDDLEGIGGVTGLLALSVHTQQLVGRLHERTDALVALNHRLSEAHEQERAHLSRELHDVVAQELIALTRQLRRYGDGDGATPPPAIWADMLAAAQDALTATRRICNGLRPAILDLGLGPALRDLVAGAAEHEDAPEVSLSIEGAEQRLAGEVEFALFRVAQEGLNNALNHAGARQVRVEALFNGGVRLRVRDNGRGFVVPRRFEDLPGDHLGLIGMRERLMQLGGALTIASEPGRGTVLEASAGAPVAGSAESVDRPSMTRRSAGG